MKRFAFFVTVGWLTIFSCLAGAQNGSSFLDADRSSVRYNVASSKSKTACGSFVSLTNYDYSVISSSLVPATDEAPEHCRISGVIQPEILFEVNLPTNWNRRLYMHGNGGYAGTPPDSPNRARHRNNALRHHFATAYTNTGHDRRVEPLGTFAYNNPQKEIDYSYRAVHLTVVTAKELIRLYYDRELTYSYWDGCSTGGRQGLMSAQRFPGDFDGIIAGAPVLNCTGTQIWGAWNAKALLDAPIRMRHVEMVAREVYANCDGIDGLEDGLIEDPRQCDFDPEVHLPRCIEGSDKGSCFTSGQMDALKKIYGGVISRGEVIYPGLVLGAEAVGTTGEDEKASGWAYWIVNEEGPSRQLVYAETFLKYMAFPEDDPNYDWTQFDFDEDPARIRFIRTILDATDPDLSEFKDRGGKIIGYFGWGDTALNPLMNINYYEQVAAAMGEPPSDFYRLFLVPGMFHCRGGIGVDRFDAFTPLVNWVEQGVAPQTLLAAQVDADRVKMTRPLCPYPEVARYKGVGSTNEASNFSCRLP